jgi:2-oxoglutarate dehydrogenase E1 component
MSDSQRDQFYQSSKCFAESSAYIESLYEDYLAGKRDHIATSWKTYFEQLSGGCDVSHRLAQKGVHLDCDQQQNHHEVADLHWLDWVEKMRQLGHRHANISPIHPPAVGGPMPPQTSISADFLKRMGFTGQAKDFALHIQKCYRSTTGYEFKHLESDDEIAWFQKQIEPVQNALSHQQQQAILYQLACAEGMEHFLARTFVGQKRFSLEGGESLIPCLQAVIDHGVSNFGVKELVMGMAHRGRLSVMLNIFGMQSAVLKDQFAGKYPAKSISGDVKYHLGYSCDRTIGGRPVHLSLECNPSHLEFIGSVVLGSCRSRQANYYQEQPLQACSVIIHGDAAMMGQGVVAETFNLSQTPAHDVKGSVHIILNNQIGFTCSNPQDARSSRYCSDVAKMIAAPVIHVNGDDPIAVVRAAQLAVAYRQTFAKDVIIDLVCYRRLGHNEGDEPRMTQPKMYQVIDQLPTVAKRFSSQLIEQGVIDQSQWQSMQASIQQKLTEGDAMIDTHASFVLSERRKKWLPYCEYDGKKVDTKDSQKHLKALGTRLVESPAEFQFQRQVKRVIDNRQAMLNGDKPIDWGFAEMLAYASLQDRGYRVRLVGQDCGRGTFGHRHCVYHDSSSGKRWYLLGSPSIKSSFEVYDSVLSESGVIGFEYGYAKTDPNTLVIWEAQYGDFANGAQVFMDQFISSAWQKWERLCGMVLLLPHGYEGEGPEHSSARMERYLQLAAQNNMLICMPTSPSQIYHLLKAQMMGASRRPLIVMTPKSLLRHPDVIANWSDLSEGEFLPVLEDQAMKVDRAERCVLCSGKVAFDLMKKQREVKDQRTVILRLEQLYPFPTKILQSKLASLKHLKKVVWCQEEPENQGAWRSIRHDLEGLIGQNQSLTLVSRPSSASPAVGYASVHRKEQADLVNQIFGDKSK